MKLWRIYRRLPGGMLIPLGASLAISAPAACRRARETGPIDGRWRLAAVRCDQVHEER
jgi:hypothetical protein